MTPGGMMGGSNGTTGSNGGMMGTTSNNTIGL